MIDMIISSLDDSAVLRAWRKPVVAISAPAPERHHDHLHLWHVVTTSSGNVVDVWSGSTPLLAGGSWTCTAAELIKVTAQTPSFLDVRVGEHR